MEISFESDKMALKVRWLPENSSLSLIEYIDNWIAISKHINVLTPLYLLIDTYELEYRTVNEVNIIFNDITQRLMPENIAFVACNNILGKNTLSDLLKNCPLKGHIIFENFTEGLIWFESHKQ